jgi:hypothetical protein
MTFVKANIEIEMESKKTAKKDFIDSSLRLEAGYCPPWMFQKPDCQGEHVA